MHRTQILLEDWQYQRMKTIAEKEGRSLSSLIRDAVTAFLGKGSEPGPPRKLAEITGIAADPDTRGRDHDDVLYRPRRKNS